MTDLFAYRGVHTIVDGQYGSTGKGVLAAFLAKEAITRGVQFNASFCNAGPNSGHTFYHGDEKHVLKQLPTFGVASHLLGNTMPIILTAGAIIDPAILNAEADRYPDLSIFVHPNAAVIMPEDREAEHSGSIAAVAGTRSGTGAALARKVHRDPHAVVGANRHLFRGNITVSAPLVEDQLRSWKANRLFNEVSQGFSLGVNQQFYPKCTSRECTVSQSLADASLPPHSSTKTYMSVRTYPIRVGNVDGHSSGDWYPDQHEITWQELGVAAELTTVTKRERRVATFSAEQFYDAAFTNDPDFVFLNFVNYLPEGEENDLVHNILSACRTRHRGMLISTGPKSSDVKRIA